MASPFHQPYLPPSLNPYSSPAPISLSALPAPAPLKPATPPQVDPSLPPAEPILPSPNVPSPTPNDDSAAAQSQTKKKAARAGHGVGAGGGGASTYKNKPPMWVPPPTYPYNLIPGRDLYADVIPPRPTEDEQYEGFGWYKIPFPEDSQQPEAGPSTEVKKKKKSSGKKKKEGDAEDGGLEAEDDLSHAGAAAAGLESAPGAEAPVKKKKLKTDANKAKLTEQGKDEKEKWDKSAIRTEKSSQKAKTSTTSSSVTAKSKGTGSTSKSKSVAFTANQGVRVEGARNAIREEVEDEEEPEEEPEIDTRLYCVCKQMYDDDRIMIACDNCDDWCHPACVGLSEADLDLVDLFFCPACAASHQLQTTYKTACAQDGCRRPARLPLSKFCSDECGIECVMKRVDKWCMEIDPPPPPPPPPTEKVLAVPASRSRSKSKTKTPSPAVVTPPPEPSEVVKAAIAKLEASSAVRLAKRREGLVTVEDDSSPAGAVPSLAAAGRKMEEERILSRYRESLVEIKTQWATKVRSLAAAQARLVLLDVAIQRTEWLEFTSEGGSKCGFDSRLIMDEEEWADWVESEEGRRAFEGLGIGEDPDDGSVDPDDKAKELEAVENAVCYGRKKCERHSGWQKMKKADFELEQRLLDESLQKLKAREQDLRAKIADIETLRTPPNTISRRPMGSFVVNSRSPPRTPPPVQVIVVAPSSPMQVDHSVIGPSLDALAIETHAQVTDLDIDMKKDGDVPEAKSLEEVSPLVNGPTSNYDANLEASLDSVVGLATGVSFPPVGFDGNDADMQDVEVDVLG